MLIVIDTNVCLRSLDSPDRLASGTRTRLLDPRNTILLSTVSLWEIAIKSSLGREDFRHDPRDIATAAADQGFMLEAPGLDAFSLVATLPLHHRDPFDRMLVAQAIALGATLLTTDRTRLVYGPFVELA